MEVGQGGWIRTSGVKLAVAIGTYNDALGCLSHNALKAPPSMDAVCNVHHLVVFDVVKIETNRVAFAAFKAAVEGLVAAKRQGYLGHALSLQRDLASLGFWRPRSMVGTVICALSFPAKLPYALIGRGSRSVYGAVAVHVFPILENAESRKRRADFHRTD